jgi:hypothetical protein
MVFMAGSPCRIGDGPFCGRAGGASITCQVIAPLTRRYAAGNRSRRFFSGQARHGRVKYLLRRIDWKCCIADSVRKQSRQGKPGEKNPFTAAHALRQA